MTIGVNFLGFNEFYKKQLKFDATPYNSKILMFGLFGDMALRRYWGDNLRCLVTVGGFYPKFKPPVMTIRGKLLRKYPGTIVCLHEAKWKLNPNDSRGGYLFGDAREAVPPPYSTGCPQDIIHPAFSAALEPDIYFLGFDLDVQTAQGGINDPNAPDCYFAFQEQAGEIWFGAGEDTASSTVIGTSSPSSAQQSWNGLALGHIQNNVAGGFIDAGGSATTAKATTLPATNAIQQPVRGRHSADMAPILLQVPLKLHTHSRQFIPA